MMKAMNPNLQLEVKLHNQIYEALQGKWVEYIFNLADLPTQDNQFLSIANGTFLKVTEKSMPWFYSLCRKTLERLTALVDEEIRLYETIDFYITNLSI